MPRTSEMIESNYLKKEDVGEDGTIVTVAEIGKVNVARQDETPEYRWTMQFEEFEKPMVLNATNIKLTEKALGSDDTDEWVGKKLIAYNDPNVSFGKELVGGIRIRPFRKAGPPRQVSRPSPQGVDENDPPRLMADFATEHGHWYAKDGAPAYTMTGKNGAERAVTLRDARPLGLLPSVTSIINMAAKPALERWKREQVLMAALTLPRLPDEPEGAFLKRIEQDAPEQAAKAREKGSAIHGAIEKHYRSQPPDAEFWPHVQATFTAINTACGEQAWRPERSFASARGFGGKVDLHSDGWVLDFKTKEFTLENIPAIYDEHAMQLAAYRFGLGVPEARCAVVWVATSGEIVRVWELADEILLRGFMMFDALLDFWRAKNNYQP